MKAACQRCATVARLRGGYCSLCRSSIDELLRHYVHAASSILAVGTPLDHKWTELDTWRAAVGLPVPDAVRAIAPIASDWLRRYAAFAASDGEVSTEELEFFRRSAKALHAEKALVSNLDQHLYRQWLIGTVRAGNLPRAYADDLHLPTDEHCYLNVPALRRRHLKTGIRESPGQLVVTNRKVRFVAYERGGEVSLGKVHSVLDLTMHDLSLQTTSTALSGDYRLSDAEWAAAVIETALKIDRRVILPRAGSSRAAIPPHVKAEVWQRDQGKCRECGATDYLEYDHVIPRSRGGADTVNNLQILCRRCNLAKSNKL